MNEDPQALSASYAIGTRIFAPYRLHLVGIFDSGVSIQAFVDRNPLSMNPPAERRPIAKRFATYSCLPALGMKTLAWAGTAGTKALG